MSGPTVLVDVADGVARLTLNRPDVANAIDPGLADALADTTRALRARDDVRVVLLGGAGARFCGGGDVRGFAAAGQQLGEHLRRILTPLHRAVADLDAIGAPVVAAVQGTAAGAGLALVAGADLVVAAAGTRFVLAYTGIGLVPDGGSTWHLPRLLGRRRAAELAFTNRVLDADEARDWGLVTRVVPGDQLAAEVDGLVASLAAGPAVALRATKRLLRDPSPSLDEQLAREAAAMAHAGGTRDAWEGAAAFVAKRPPVFGRG